MSKMSRALSMALFCLSASFGQVSLTTLGSPSTQNFDTLANTGTSSTLPTGWAFLESAANANNLYTAGTGSGNAGDTYSFGAAASTERAFGQLRSNALVSVIGASFGNNTGGTINSLAIAYRGERWRVGAINRTDQISFEYSLNATSLSTGTWTPATQLDFVAGAALATGAVDGNASATNLSATITALSISNGATFWIRWIDTDAAGADDGLAVDDFSVTPSGSGGGNCPIITLSPTTLPNGSQGAAYSQTIVANGGVAPYTFTATGTFPTGIGISSAGVIGGATNSAGTFSNIQVTATDSTAPTACTGSSTYSLTIDPVFTLSSIGDIQGPGLISPFNGQNVTTEGIVTAVRNNGFYLQSQTPDGNPLTSEGILVFTGGAPAVVQGQRVRVGGTVDEFVPSTDPAQAPVTEITGPTVSVLSSGNPLPAPAAITAADLTTNGGQNQLERFEGMRVTVASLTVVAATDGTVNEPNATSTSSGFFYAVITGTPTPFREPGIQAPTPVPVCAAGSGCAIPVFDNNPERIEVDSDRINGTTAANLRVGQVVTNIVGVLDFSFRAYQIYPDGTAPLTISGAGVAEGVAPTPRASEVTVATYNLERFFDTVNDPAVSDVAVTAAAFAGRLNKLSLAIRNNLLLPDVIGFEEVENLAVAQAIANKVNTDAGIPGLYTAYLSEGIDPGGIDVAFLVKNTVSVASVTQAGRAATYTNPCTLTQEDLNDRPPLLLRGVVTKGGRTLDLIVIVNHLRSLNGIDDEAACSDGRRVRAKRAAQAEYLANLIQFMQALSPNAKIISVGDMNAFEFNDGYVDSIGTIVGNPTAATQVAQSSPDLVNPNLLNLLNIIPDPAQRFSYVFDGSHQTLDHLIYSQSLKNQVTNGGYVRLNSEFPETDRNDTNSPRRLSDHDPGLIYVTTAQSLGAGVQILRSGLVLNNLTNTYNGTVYIRNTGSAAIAGPFTLALGELTGGVSLANATGSNFQGAFIVDSTSTLNAGALLAIPVRFSNPGSATINYTPKAYSGAF